MTLPVATVERIIREAGVERVSSSATKAMINASEAYIKAISSKAYSYTQHAGRNTLKDVDILAALNGND